MSGDIKVTRGGLVLLLCLACVCALGCAEPPVPAGPAGPLVINRAAPAVSSISPGAAVAGSPSRHAGHHWLLILQTMQSSRSAVKHSSRRSLTGSQITVSIPSSMLVQVGTRAVAVTNPAPGGGITYALTPFQVHCAAASAIPAIFDDHSAQHSRQRRKSVPGTRQPGLRSTPGRRPGRRPSLRHIPGRRPRGSASVRDNAQRDEHDGSATFTKLIWLFSLTLLVC